MTFKTQRGGFVLGMVAGLLIGLALALGVALYITKAPNVFVNKVPHRTAEQDNAEIERNRNWDPNAPLGTKPAPRTAASATGASAPLAGVLPALGSKPAAKDPAVIAPATPASAPKSTIAGAEPFMYFVQAGAFTRTEDAEQQRARLAMLGVSAKITEREQAGRTVYRVRLGPYSTRNEADALNVRLQEASIEAQLVRVERP
jgi:cell division protein FtsN